MKRTVRRILIGFLFGFVVYLVLVLLSDVRQVGAQLRKFDWRFVPLILAGTLFNYILRFVKWHYYLRLIGIRDLNWIESGRIFVAGFPLAVTPGKVGEALKGFWLQHWTGTSTSLGISVVLAERVSDGLAVLVLSSLGVIAYPRYWPLFVIILGSLLIFIILTQFRSLMLPLIAWTSRLPVLHKGSGVLRELYEGSHLLFRPTATVIAVGLGTVAWLGEGVAMYLVLLGLGIPPSGETLAIAVFTLSFSTVVGAISALPGGIGAAEASIAGMLTLLMMLPTGLATAATLLIRFATLWFGVGLGLLLWVFSRDLILLEGEAQKA
jgi:uncharacterized protein (TIRG00374 family)